MGLFSQFNKGRQFDIDTKDFGACKLEELLKNRNGEDTKTWKNDEFEVSGFFFTQSEDYGESLCVISEPLEMIVYFPSHAIESFKAFSDEHIEAIKKHMFHVGNFKKYEFTKGRAKGKTTIYFDFIDAEEVPFN